MLSRWAEIFLDGNLNYYKDVFLEAITFYCDSEKLKDKTNWYRGILEELHGVEYVKNMNSGDELVAMISDFKNNINLDSILELSDFESWTTLLDKVFDI